MAIINLTVNNFNEVALNSQKPVLIDFYATWCGPCKMMAPIVEEIANTRDDVVVCKVDVDEEGAIANAYDIHSIPTLVLLKDGKLADKAVGYRPLEAVLEMLK
ncbi:MAG: thioredoxin [Ruminococcaceae bacterium]|nr:thioredoxin [Oscillospiraceae bacterium]